MKSNSKTQKKHSNDISNTSDIAIPHTASYSEMIYNFSKNPDELREVYLHIKYLNDETVKLLFERHVPKEFFEEAQLPKTRLILDLVANRTSQNEITRLVSLAVQLFLEEYESSGRVTNWKNLSRFIIESEKPFIPLSKMKANILEYQPVLLFEVEPKRPENIQPKIKSKQPKKNKKLKVSR